MGGRAYNYTPLLRLPLHWNEGGMTDGHLHNELTNLLDDIVGNMGRSWKNPVPNVGDLPPTLNTLGDARVVTTSSEIYIWNGSAWVSSTGGALTYMGIWAATNPPAGGSPTLSDATGGKGHYYVVSASGTQDLGSGPIDFNPGDWVVHNGTVWQKADHTDTVTSVFSRQGAVVALASDYDASQVDNDSGVSGVFVSNALDTLDSGKEPAFTKNTAFNKNFGALAGDVCQGNDARLSDARTPTLHAGTHEGGSDPMTPGGIGAEPAFSKNTAFNKNFGAALGDVCQGNDARLSDARTPLAHRASHISGGSDAFLAADVLEAIVKRLQETGGPTTLTMGAVPDNNILVRSGSSIIGATSGLVTGWGVTPGDNTGPGASSGSVTPTHIRYKGFPGTTIFGSPTTLTILARSSGGNPGFVDIYNLDTGLVLMSISGIVSTATGGAAYSTTTIVNPFPAGPARFAIRVYRGGAAATITLYDLKLS